MTTINPDLKAHIATKKIAHNIENEAMALVNATNIMSGEEYMATGLLMALEQSDNDLAFYALFRAAIPSLIERLSPTDGRIEGTISLLRSLDGALPKSNRTFQPKIQEALVLGLLRNHPTLIQSFFRVFRMVASALEDSIIAESMRNRSSDIKAYANARDNTLEAAQQLLLAIGEANIETNPNDRELITILARIQTPLSFI